MATTTVALDSGWTKVANAGETFTATVDVAVRYATTDTDTDPTVRGHRVPRGSDGYGLTREISRAGYVHLTVEPPNNAATAYVDIE